MFQIMFLMAMQEFSNLKIIDIRSEFSSIRDFSNAPELNFNTDQNVFSNNV